MVVADTELQLVQLRDLEGFWHTIAGGGTSINDKMLATDASVRPSFIAYTYANDGSDDIFIMVRRAPRLWFALVTDCALVLISASVTMGGWELIALSPIALVSCPTFLS